MAESYFDLLTTRQGLPAKPFDPLEELRLLRRKLTERLQTLEPPMKPPLAETVETALSPHHKAEPVSLEVVANKEEDIERTVERTLGETITLPLPLVEETNKSRPVPLEAETQRGDMRPRIVKSHTTGQILDTLNGSLITLGIIGIVFGMLSFFRGWEGDLPLGSLISVSGLAIVVIGLGGRFLAKS